MENKMLMLDEIKNLIPHREPFLFIDKLINIEKLNSFFDGHFPGHPVVPGVILIETMAQTAAALIAYSIKNETFDKIVYLMNVENTKFRRPVFPGEIIYSNVFALRSKGRVWRFSGEIFNDKNDKVAQAIWSAMIMDRNSE